MPSAIVAAAQGFALGAGLIIAIGAQNAFVLRQGLLRRHVLPVVILCAASDAALIVLGVAGFGTLVSSNPDVLKAVGLAGAAFLLAYGVRAFRHAVKGGALSPLDAPPAPLGATLLTAAALTFLNPHVYLDTVVLLGGIAGRHAVDDRAWFAAGAAAASAVWFFSLGFGARLLAPLFAKPAAWRVLDTVIGMVMTVLALLLLHQVLAEGG